MKHLYFEILNILFFYKITHWIWKQNVSYAIAIDLSLSLYFYICRCPTLPLFDIFSWMLYFIQEIVFAFGDHRNHTSIWRPQQSYQYLATTTIVPIFGDHNNRTNIWRSQQSYQYLAITTIVPIFGDHNNRTNIARLRKQSDTIKTVESVYKRIMYFRFLSVITMYT